MSRFRQFFKTSESDKDDCLIITPTDEEPNEKNRKCSAAAKSSSSSTASKLPIKDKQKDKLQHLKASKSDLTTKNIANRTAANQSHFYLVINSEDADQERRRLQMIIDQTLEVERTAGRRAADAADGQRTVGCAVTEKNLKNEKASRPTNERLSDQCTITLQGGQSVNEVQSDSARSGRIVENHQASPEPHIYQNEGPIYQNDADSVERTVSDQSTVNLQSNQQTNQQGNQQSTQQAKKESARSSFTPKPLKMIKKRLRKKSKELDDQLNDRSKQSAVNRTMADNSQNSPPPNGQQQQQLNSQSQINQQPAASPPPPQSALHLLNPNGESPAHGQRRRRQNQSFENLNERLEYISQTASTSSGKPRRELVEELKPSYKSEDNLLHIVPNVPRSLAKLSANEQQFLKKVEESLTSHHSKLPDHRSHPGDLSSSLQFFSENPSYTSCEPAERVNESGWPAKHSAYYVNVLSSLDELCSRRCSKKADLISLRQLKPRHFLVPELRVTDESKELIYVNLQFNDDQPDESHDSTPASDSPKLPPDERKSADSKRADLNRADSNQADSSAALIDADLSKSSDLELLRCLRANKPSSFKQSKSDDESRGKVEYCKIDFMATESLNTLRAIRIQNHHHF